MKRDRKKSVLPISAIFILVCFLCSTAFPVSGDVINDTTKSLVSDGRLSPTVSPANSYATYSAQHASISDGKATIVRSGGDYLSESESTTAVVHEHEGRENLLRWDSQKGTVTYSFHVPEDGKYTLLFTYQQLKGQGNPIRFGLSIDDSTLFKEMDTIELPILWTNRGGVRKDRWGNEFSSEQVELEIFTTQAVRDSTGVYPEPYEFALTAGIHTIKITMMAGTFLLHTIALSPPERTDSYSVKRQTYTGVPVYDGEPIYIQGEDADVKTAKTLPAKSDNREVSLTPSSATNRLINYIGSTNWSTPNQTLSWHVDIPKTGLYKLGFKFKQSDSVNNVSYRSLTINGKSPFDEAKSIAFPYNSRWQFKELSDSDGQPYLLHLEEGTCELSLTVTMAEMSEFFRKLEELVAQIGDEYIKIVMITGENPDPNRDYDLFQQIPGFMDTLSDFYSRLQELVSAFQEQTGKRSNSLIAAMQNMQRVLKSMTDNPYTAQHYKSDYYTNYTSLGAWLYDMKSMPLSLDEMVLVPPEHSIGNQNAGFFRRVGFAASRFFYSFIGDYGKSRLSGAEEGDKAITIWVNWGRDQTQILSTLIQEEFTQSTGIPVNLEIVNAGIIKGLLSGSPPDLSLHMSRTEPLNLAMRGVLVDLKQFHDFETVMQRFMPTAATPYEYKGGCYALPDTQSFYVMFYRKDILDTLGISIPRTWDEFLDATAIIQRNNMNVWIPYTRIASSTTVNTGIGGLSLLPTLIMQNNLSLFDSTMDGAALDETKAIQVFSKWADMYTRYNIPREASFYNRFRVGTMPLGVDQYTLYQTLVSAAPEIKDRWGISLIPGTPDEKGQINGVVSGQGSGAGIIRNSGVENEAWEFIKWWTSADIQEEYSREVETILGPVGRTATANIEALSRLTWNKDDLSVIMGQWKLVQEIPELPGSYYLTRAVDQAFWSVTNGTTTAKDAIVEWNQIADNEIKRKIKEYS